MLRAPSATVAYTGNRICFGKIPQKDTASKLARYPVGQSVTGVRAGSKDEGCTKKHASLRERQFRRFHERQTTLGWDAECNAFVILPTLNAEEPLPHTGY
jgi:hypothetical protein